MESFRATIDWTHAAKLLVASPRVHKSRGVERATKTLPTADPLFENGNTFYAFETGGTVFGQSARLGLVGAFINEFTFVRRTFCLRIQGIQNWKKCIISLKNFYDFSYLDQSELWD